jgi:hypothetical protein
MPLSSGAKIGIILGVVIVLIVIVVILWATGVFSSDNTSPPPSSNTPTPSSNNPTPDDTPPPSPEFELIQAVMVYPQNFTYDQTGNILDSSGNNIPLTPIGFDKSVLSSNGTSGTLDVTANIQAVLDGKGDLTPAAASATWFEGWTTKDAQMQGAWQVGKKKGLWVSYKRKGIQKYTGFTTDTVATMLSQGGGRFLP